MKLIILFPYYWLSVLFILCFEFKTTLENLNAVKSKNKNSSNSKSSIFESYRTFKVETEKENQFNIHIGKPSNLFDPNGKPFEISKSDISPRPGSAFNGSGEIDIGPGPIYFKGWVKFFRYLFDDKRKGPKAFYENPEFIEQFKKLKNFNQLEEQEDGIYKYIHNKNLFYCLLYKNEISFMKSKFNAFQTVFDTLKINYINPVSEDQGFKGGVTNMGSFKEGECFKITTSQAGRWNWVICTENPSDKLNLMNMVKKLVIKNQRQNGYVNVGNKPGSKNPSLPGSKNSTTLTGATLDTNDFGVSLNKNINDGYWMILQDWSSCTKFCGGGTQTLHRFCVPPKKGGSPCEGQAIVNRTCNEQACPGTHNINDDMPKDTNIEVLKPILNVLPFSDRPQRYDKCHIKESDLLLTTEFNHDASKTHGPKIKAIQLPVRVVMNQYTLSAYAGLNETDKKVSFDIKKVNFYTSIRDPSCFILKEYGIFQNPTTEKKELGEKTSISEAEFCPFGANSNPDIKEEWEYDFNLFKHQCHEQKKLSVVLNETEIEDELNKKKGQMRIDIANEKKKKNLLNKEEETSSYIQKVKDQSLQAIQKELKLEQIIEQEIKETQALAIEMKAKELDKEKYKLDCLNKAIKEKEIENEYNLAQAAKEDRLDNIKKQVVNTINIKRARLKSKIAKLKKLSTNQLNNMDAQIMNIRLEMMNSLNKENSYNPQKCRVLIITKTEDEFQQVKRAYCDEKMANDPDDHKKCVTADREDIIHLCCDYETNPDIPDEYKKCLKENKKNIPNTSYDDVRFFWAKPYHRLLIDDAKLKVVDQNSSKSSSSSSSSSSFSSSSSSSKSSSSSSSSSIKMS